MGAIRTVAEVSVGDALPPRTIHVERATLVQYRRSSARSTSTRCARPAATPW